MIMNRVVFINDVGTWGGAEKILYHVLKNIGSQKEIFQPCVILGSEGLLADRIRQLSLPVYVEPIPENSRNFVSLIKWGVKVSQIARMLKPDLIYINTLRSIIFTSSFLKLLRKPVVWHEHNIQPSFIRRTVLNLLALWLPNRIIAVSQAVADPYWDIIRKHKIQVIHNALDLSDFSREFPKDIRKEFNIPDKDSIVTVTSVLRPWKGHEYFIRAAHLVKRKYPESKFLILGEEVMKKDKGYKQWLAELCKSLDLENDIIFTGFRDDVPHILLQSDIIVLPSILPDPFPTVVLEAMAAAKPIVATDIGGIPEMVENEKTGLLVPPKDYEALANAILRLLMDREFACRLGRSGFTRLTKAFGIDRFNQEITKILLKLLTRPN